MLFAAVAPDTKVVPYLCPLPFQAIPRDVKRCAPAPLRWATPSFLSGIYGSNTTERNARLTLGIPKRSDL